MKSVSDASFQAVVGVLILVCGAWIVLGALSTFRPARPSYMVGWSVAGGLVLVLGACFVHFARRRARS